MTCSCNIPDPIISKDEKFYECKQCKKNIMPTIKTNRKNINKKKELSE